MSKMHRKRDSASYRSARRNLFRTTEEGIVIRKRNPDFINLARDRITYHMEHPELIRKISNRGEVHYTTGEK